MAHIVDPEEKIYICSNCRDTMKVRCSTCGGKGCMDCGYQGWKFCPYCTKHHPRRRHGDKKGYRYE